MDAKYVITSKGQVAIFSKYMGMEHRDVAGEMDALAVEKTIAGAGFCSMVGDQLITFGRSTSTGIAAQPEDAATLTELLHKNALVLVFIAARLGYIATNAPECFDGEHTPCTIDTLGKSRIFK